MKYLSNISTLTRKHLPNFSVYWYSYYYQHAVALKTFNLSRFFFYLTSLDTWEYFRFFLKGWQLQEHIHLSGIPKKKRREKRTSSESRGVNTGETRNTELLGGANHGLNDGERCDKHRLEEKTKQKGPKTGCYFVFFFVVFFFQRLIQCPSLPSLSLFLSSPWGDLFLACPDGLESVPGKTGHPSPPLHLTPPPSPL